MASKSNLTVPFCIRSRSPACRKARLGAPWAPPADCAPRQYWRPLASTARIVKHTPARRALVAFFIFRLPFLTIDRAPLVYYLDQQRETVHLCLRIPG